MTDDRLAEAGKAMTRYEERIAKLENDLRLMERDLRGKRAHISRLERELHEHYQQHPMKREADECFEYWRDHCKPRVKEFSGDRLKNVIARLQAGATVEDVKRAVDGAVVGAFVGENGVRHDDIELICRSPEKLQSFIARADAHEARQALKARANPSEGGVRPERAVLPPLIALQGYVQNLQGKQAVLDRAREVKGWTPEVLARLGVGWDRGRFTIPVRDQAGDLVNVLRYVPGGDPKLLASRGRARDLFPRPEEVKGRILLVEGEPDAVSGWSIGIGAVAVPGVAWLDGNGEQLAARLNGRQVTVLFDCDEPGRTAAQRAASALKQAGVAVQILDLAPARADGYDLGDFVREGGNRKKLLEQAVSVLIREGVGEPARPVREPVESRPVRDGDPALGVLAALDRAACGWKPAGRDRWMAQCPAHADRIPSLSITQVEGEDGAKVLLKCFAGCESEAVITALGLTWHRLFGAA